MTEVELSVVVPIYDEETVLPELRRRLEAALDALAVASEIILVDDGSRDHSRALLAAWAEASPRVRLVELARNFGHAAACTAGLDAAAGRAVVLMDGDLQDPPELLAALLAEWRAGCEIVYAERRTRAEGFPRKQLIGLFHRVFTALTELDMPPGVGIFSVMDRRVVDELRQMPERNRFLPGLRSFVGFRVGRVAYDRAERAAGAPKQSYWRLVRYGLDAIFSFSRRPLQISTLLGLVVAAAAALYAMVLIVLRLLQFNVVAGFTTVAAGMFFLGGVQLISIGILGEYISRIYDEVKRRPLYVVRRRVGFREVEPAVADAPGSPHAEREEYVGDCAPA